MVDLNKYDSDIRSLVEKILVLIDCINDPETRDVMASKKVDLIEKMVIDEMKKRPGVNWKTERISKVYKETNTLTHNFILSLGDKSSGPNIIIFVHHDVIKANKLNGKNTLIQEEDGTLRGQTLQDDTVHLAGVIEMLKNIDVPNKGAITVVFTDYEENGCRGSGALAEDLPLGINIDFPVALIALESTKGKLGLGHRGKLKTEILINNTQSVDVQFLYFYSLLYSTEIKAYESSVTTLGRTSGTSTFGTVFSDKGLSAILDIRTNEDVSPNKVLEIFENLRQEKAFDLVRGLKGWVKKCLREGVYEFSLNRGHIEIKTNSKILHPANLDPNKDESALPILYFLVAALRKIGLGREITNITWGDANKQNSVPVMGVVKGSFDIEEKELLGKMEQLLENDFIDEVYADDIEIVNTVMTDAVNSKEDEVVKSVLEKTGLKKTYLQFMTDLGRPFSEFKSQGFNTYAFVYGVGDPVRLHQDEEVDLEDIKLIKNFLPKIVNAIFEELIVKL